MMKNKSDIYTITLNPAVDKVLFLDELIRGRTCRLSRLTETLGGKGTHVSISLKLLGVESTALGITLGANGRKITGMMSSWGVETHFLHYDLPGMESRTNYEIVETISGSCTMLPERGPILPAHITDDLLRQMQTMLKVDDYLVLTGDASNVEDTTIYIRLANAARGLGARVLLDASGPYLAEGIRSKPYLVKPNEEELNHLAGRELNNEDEVIAFLLSTLFDGIAIIALTRGEKGALIKFGKELYTIPPVQVSVKNTVGCGDAFLAGLLAGIARGESPAETLSLAAAAGAAKAEYPETVGFDPLRAQELRATIHPVKLQ